MLSEIQNKCIKKLISKLFSSENANVKPELDNMQLNMVEIYRKYNDPGKVDSLWGLKNDVNEIKLDINKSMTTIVNNVTELNVRKFIKIIHIL